MDRSKESPHQLAIIKTSSRMPGRFKRWVWGCGVTGFKAFNEAHRPLKPPESRLLTRLQQQTNVTADEPYYMSEAKVVSDSDLQNSAVISCRLCGFCVAPLPYSWVWHEAYLSLSLQIWEQAKRTHRILCRLVGSKKIAGHWVTQEMFVVQFCKTFLTFRWNLYKYILNLLHKGGGSKWFSKLREALGWRLIENNHAGSTCSHNQTSISMRSSECLDRNQQQPWTPTCCMKKDGKNTDPLLLGRGGLHPE